MKKNERLFDLLGDVSPDYIARANPKEKKHTVLFPFSVKKTVSLLAAIIALSVLACALLLPGSATVPEEGDVPYYEFGTVLTEAPRMLLASDFEALRAMMDQKVAQNPEMANIYLRFKSFYTLQSIGMQNSERAREAMRTIYPITELTDVYTVDPESTQVELEFIIYWLMYYGEVSQEMLIEMSTNLHDTVNESSWSEEKKQAALATLPEIPVIIEGTPAFYWISGEKLEGTELRFSTALLPKFLTEDGMNRMKSWLNTNAEEYGEDAYQLFMATALYRPCPTGFNSKDSEEMKEKTALLNEHMSAVSKALSDNGQKLYVLMPHATIHAKTMFCYYISQHTDVTAEQMDELSKSFFDTLRALPLPEEEIDQLIEDCLSLEHKLAE